MILYICIAVLATIPCFFKFKHAQYDYWGEDDD